MILTQEFTELLNLDGFIFFIEGKKGRGKTNAALLIAEICYGYGYRKHIATNIKCESFFIKQITNYPDLENWLIKTNGKKLFILDESGEHIARMGFMSTKNRQFMTMLQKIRHFDCGFIGIAPSQKRVDSGFLNTDILDAQIKKVGFTIARVTDFYHDCSFFINDLPKTSISYNSKDLAVFSMEKEEKILLDSELKDCCIAAKYYLQTKHYDLAGKFFNPPKERMQVRRLVLQHLAHLK